MKRSGALILFLLLLILPLTCAIEIEMKTEFDGGETLLAKVSGNFLEPILEENVFFYRGHVRMPMQFDVAKIGEDFYIYALTPEQSPNNYTLTIKDVQYMKGSQISEEEISMDFSVSETSADFSVNPGFVIAKEDFSIEVQNLQESALTINYQEGEENQSLNSINLKSGEIKSINFPVDIDDPVFKTIQIRTENLVYSIPVYLYLETEALPKEQRFVFDPSESNFSLPTDSDSTRIISLYNTGEKIIRNISLAVSETLKPYANISQETIEELEVGESVQLEVYLFSEEERNVVGSIRAQTEDELLVAYSEFYVTFMKDFVPFDISITKTCAELGGSICAKNQTCSGESVNAKDTSCCIGGCEEVKSSPVGKIIGWALIIIIVSLVAFFIIRRYHKPKPSNRLKTSERKPIIRNRSSQVEQFKKMQQQISQPKPQPKPIQKIQQPIIKYVEKPIIKEKIVEKPVIKEIEKIVEKPVIHEIEKKVLIERPKRPAPPKFKYKGSTTSKTVHKTSCRLAKLIKQKYKITGNDLDYFKKQGYTPCKVCLKKK